jgi:hypothetical protein
MSLEIKENNYSTLEKSCISYQFRADGQTYDHRTQYTADNEAAKPDVYAKNASCCLTVAAAASTIGH